VLDWFRSLNFNLTDYFSLTSIIDIAIVAFVSYRLMLLIKGTRAVQLLKGIAVLVVASALSSLFQLYTLQWLLKQAMTALVVALPVVFQPELRRALEKIGGSSFLSSQFSGLGEDDRDHLVAEIVQAVRLMSRGRIGALIVLERSTGLEEYIDSGVRIDSLVSNELINNLFIPRSPLHDGAVIIRGNRLLAAACVLPLTQEQKLGKSMGTRHRAGIGITEQSDAVAVIVSEETGTVSLALEGILFRDLDNKKLSDKLSRALRPVRQVNAASVFSRHRR